MRNPLLNPLRNIVVLEEAPRGNLGEWSELYALGYLLAHGGAYEADEQQNSDPRAFHSVKEIWLPRDNSFNSQHFLVENSEAAIHWDSVEVQRVSKSMIEAALEEMLEELALKSNRGTFPLDAGSQLLKLLMKNSVSANSNSKTNDLEVVFQDLDTGATTPRVGFSIKSQLGARSTLLNASQATNFTYKILSKNPRDEFQFPVFIHGKHKQNLNRLINAGYSLEFHKVKSEIFNRNLTKIDMQFPAILARVLLHSYITGQDNFAKATQSIFQGDDLVSEQSVFKLKEFLGAVAMGLRPSTIWRGKTTTFNGMLIVKSSGEIVFNYLNEIKNFEEYLFNSVSFERPSTSRHKYGHIYENQGESYIDLNLQIRFLK